MKTMIMGLILSASFTASAVVPGINLQNLDFDINDAQKTRAINFIIADSNVNAYADQLGMGEFEVNNGDKRTSSYGVQGDNGCYFDVLVEYANWPAPSNVVVYESSNCGN